MMNILNDYKEFIEKNKNKSYEELFYISEIYKEIYKDTYRFVSVYIKILLTIALLCFILLIIAYFVNANSMIKLGLIGCSISCAFLSELVYRIFFIPLVKRYNWILNRLIKLKGKK